MPPPNETSPLADWLSWQERLHPRSIALGLERVTAVAKRLQLTPSAIRTLTVAGTNGKGSSSSLLAEIYRAAGYSVGLYTSPHLHRYNERIAINGQCATDRDLVRAFAAIEAVRADTSLTYFEYGTLAALWLFREARVQVQVLEVGLGGRLDAVNLVDADAAMVTSIGLDHQDWLGPDRESIGREKTGVFRQGRPAVCADPQPPVSLQSWPGLLQTCREFQFHPVADGWNWSGQHTQYKKLPLPALGGAHQLQNAAGVLALVEAMQSMLPVPETAIRSALVRLHLRGRFEQRGAFIFDVAHNVEAAQALAAQLGTRRVVLVLGMLSDKPVEDFCRALAGHVDRALVCGLPGPRGLSAQDLYRRCQTLFTHCEMHDDIPAAVQHARSGLASDQSVLVCGSFLTVAAAQEAFDE